MDMSVAKAQPRRVLGEEVLAHTLVLPQVHWNLSTSLFFFFFAHRARGEKHLRLKLGR